MNLKLASWVAIAATLATASAAVAQPVAPGGAPFAPMPPSPPANHRSPGVGVGLGIAGTIVPVVGMSIGLAIDDRDASSKVVLVSLLAGAVFPAAGLAYAHNKRSYGLPVRTLGVVLVGLSLLFDSFGDNRNAQSLFATGGLLYLGGAAIDIGLTPSAVKDYNERQDRGGLTLVPLPLRDGAGLGIAAAF